MTIGRYQKLVNMSCCFLDASGGLLSIILDSSELSLITLSLYSLQIDRGGGSRSITDVDLENIMYGRYHDNYMNFVLGLDLSIRTFTNDVLCVKDQVYRIILQDSYSGVLL